MAAKVNASADTIDLTAYDYVASCGACHPGGGSFEFQRNPDGTAGTARYNASAEAAAPDFDGDYWTLATGGTGQKSRWAASGVVEADCLLCHLPGYNIGARNAQLARRNYQWSAAAGLGATVTGAVLSDGAFTGVTPSVSYSGAVVFDGANVNGALIAARPPAGNCLFCHEASDTKKRALEWSGAYDVHAGAGKHCLDCHGMVDPADQDRDWTTNGQHNIGKGYARLGSVRNDLDGTMARTCAGCHLGGEDAGAPNPTAAHGATFPQLDFHFAKLACESCHIPDLKWNQGYLIDMSAGTQWWVLSNGLTPGSPAHFNTLYSDGATGWKPFLKRYDPDGPAGPLAPKYFPFGAKSSAWFGNLDPATGEVQPIFLRHVKAAYAAAGAGSTATVHLVGGGTATRPSVHGETAIQAMIDELKVAQNGHPAFPNPVYVGAEILGYDAQGTFRVLSEYEAESCHDFSVNHDVQPAANALGARGCGDCHAPGTALYNPQVRDVTGFLARRAAEFPGVAMPQALLDDPEISESMLAFRGFAAAQEEALLDAALASDPSGWHAMAVSYAFEGANTCAQCHAGEVEAFRDTVHYSSRSVVENENFFFPGGGKHGMLDRACALVGSNMLLNMITTGYDSTATGAAEGGAPAQQCGSCHTNYYNTLMEGFIALQAGPQAARALMLSGVDCLVCHAEHYDYDLRRTLEDDPLGPMSPNLGFGTVNGRPQRIRQDRSPQALASIVRTPTDHMCLRCHEHGRTDYKRGELPDAAFDAHYASGSFGGNPCLKCHEARDHKFNRGAMVNGDIFASDYPVNGPDNDTSCLTCHAAPVIHRNARIEEHLGALACETCHIPWTSGAATTVWADGGFLALAKGGEENRPVQLYTKKEGNRSDSTNEQLWNRYKQRPIYMPFSGLTSFLAQPIPVTNFNTGQAPKIWPFKTIINPLPFDGRFFGVGLPAGQSPVGPDGINVYSMFAAMRMFADQYKALGFMDADFDFAKFAVDPDTGVVGTTVAPTDPKYPSYAAMAQMAQFPNLLFFDKYTFGYNWYQDLGKLDAAGKIQRWDEEGPLARPLAVKDLRKAVEVGMGRLLDMMVQMGFDPAAYGMTADQMKGMYSTAGLSADQLVVMAAPPGSEVQAMLAQMGGVNPLVVQNYPAWSNGVTLGGHGVSRTEALYCADCHDAAKSVFSQKVEVPDYGPSGMPLFHWEFYSRELLAKAEAGEFVADVWADGYALRSASFEMGRAFVAASQAAASFSPPITTGVDGEYLAVLTPTTRLATNWEVLGYSPRRIAELTGVSTDGDPAVPGDVGSGRGGSSECFVQALGAGAPTTGWLAAGLLAALGLALRRK